METFAVLLQYADYINFESQLMKTRH